jgi:hypothetical protein
MAQKRMFDKAIIETDNFLNVSISAKALYFLLGMEADDEGFVSPNRVIRLYGGEAGDLKNLIDTGLVIPFKSGVVVITDWHTNNYLDKNRSKPTQYIEEKKQLSLIDLGKNRNSSDKKYILTSDENNGFNTCLTDVKLEEKRIEEKRIEEKRIEENNMDTNYKSEITKKFKKPSLEEVSQYCKERSNQINPNKFIDFYESNGWKVGRNPMKDWRACVRTWEGNNYSTKTTVYKNNETVTERDEKMKKILSKVKTAQ